MSPGCASRLEKFCVDAKVADARIYTVCAQDAFAAKVRIAQYPIEGLRIGNFFAHLDSCVANLAPVCKRALNRLPTMIPISAPRRPPVFGDRLIKPAKRFLQIKNRGEL